MEHLDAWSMFQRERYEDHFSALPPASLEQFVRQALSA
jgi:hypothetical protein